MRGIVRGTRLLTLRKLMVGAAALGLALALPAGADTAYHPPFEAGPQGGDGNNQIMTDPSTGRVTIVRANVSPGAFNCGGNGPFAFLRVSGTGPVSHVKATFTQAVVDPYTWVEVLVKDAAGEFATPAAIERGPLAGDGSLEFDLAEPIADGAAFTIDVGLETASACPNVDGGTVMFTEVAVR